MSISNALSTKTLNRALHSLAALLMTCTVVHAQNSSLFQQPYPEVLPPISANSQLGAINPATPESGSVISPITPYSSQLMSASWTYNAPPPRVCCEYMTR